MDLVNTLKEAAAAYYNGQPLKMDDDTYDLLLERLRVLDPTNPYLETIGAPSSTPTPLPYPMPSLDKIKPGQDTLARFLQNGPFVVSEKLDGLSALWIPAQKKLYLRGDGVDGQDISNLATGLGLKGSGVVRGELVVPRSVVNTLARSWVNGVIHRKDAVDDLRKIHFVAYDLLEPAMPRSKQFEWLRAAGYEIPWWETVKDLNEDYLKRALLARREQSIYDTDGIVVGRDVIPVRTVKNPKDAVAFKMPLADQRAETTVRAVLWAPSAQGYLIPKLEVDPVAIGGATIRFCTAHSARNVVENKLGPGAKIILRRSGDVIPTIDTVLSGTIAQMPDVAWEWQGVHIRATEESPALTSAKLYHFLKTLGVPGGPAGAAALVEGGITGPATLWKASATKLSELLGPKTGDTLYKALRSLNPTELDLMVASSMMPRGVGESKLKALFAMDPDPRKWRNLTTPGWTTESLDTLLAALPDYEIWRQGFWIPYPILGVQTVQTKSICFTGFRDKALEALAVQKGFSPSSVLTGRTTILAVPDTLKESEKTRTAVAKGIPMMTRTELTQYLEKQ